MKCGARAICVLAVFLSLGFLVSDSSVRADENWRADEEFRGCEDDPTQNLLPASIRAQLPTAFQEEVDGVADPGYYEGHPFTIKVTWPLGDPPYSSWPWSPSTIITAARMIMPDPGDQDYYHDELSSIANRVAQYFGHDLEDEYSLLYMGKTFQSYRSHWTIYLCASGEGSAADSVDPREFMTIGVPNEVWRRTPEMLAQNGFGHEFEHLIDHTRPEGSGSWGGSQTGEFNPQPAEHLSGWLVWDTPSEALDYDADDFRFNTSLLSHDYLDYCLDIEGDLGSRHRMYSMVAPYFLEHYEDPGYPCDFCGEKSDLLFKWIRYYFGGLEPESMPALRQLLGTEPYDEYFTATTPVARFREFWRNLYCSLWLNAANDGFKDDVAVWSHGEITPQDADGYMQNWDWLGGSEFDCNNDALSRPLRTSVKSTHTPVESPIYGDNVPGGCQNNPNGSKGKHLHVPYYGHDVLTFEIDPTEEDGTCKDFRASIIFENSIECYYTAGPPDDTWNVDITDDKYLQMLVFGYPEAYADLDQHGDDAVLLAEKGWTGNDIGALGLTRRVDVRIPCFDSVYKALAIVMILLPEDIDHFPDGVGPHGNSGRNDDVISYRYECWWEDADSYVATGDAVLPDYDEFDTGQQGHRARTLTGSTVCFSDGIEVSGPGTSLTVQPGTQLFLGDAGGSGGGAIEVWDGGELTLAGQPGAQVTVSGVNGWDGLDIGGGTGTGGSVSMTEAVLLGPRAIGILESGGSLEAEAATFEMAASPLLLNLETKSVSDAVSLTDVEITSNTQLRLGGPGSTTLDWVDLRSHTAAVYGITVHGAADVHLSNVRLYDKHIGIVVNNDGNLTLQDVSVRHKNTQAMENPIGISLRDGSALTADGLTIDGYEDAFSAGIMTRDASRILSLRNSLIREVDVGVVSQSREEQDLGMGDADQGGNCFELTAGHTVMIYAMGFQQLPGKVWAVWNWWDTATPTSAMFQGNIEWDGDGYDYLTAGCPTSAGGPEFAVMGTGGATGGSSEAQVYGYREGGQITVLVRGVRGLRARAVTLFDVAGRRVAELPLYGVAPGSFVSEPWPAASVASGVYLARVDTMDGQVLGSGKVVVVN